MGLLREGQIIRGTYEVERPLGEGAFAEVWRVRHRFLGRQAMKVFKMVGMTLAETEQLLGEAIMLSRIGHPNIIRVFDADVTETSHGVCGFFTMEYVAGGTLQQFWQSHGANLVPLETVVELVIQLCRGLAVGHAEKPPIIHRDIKPQNILVGYDRGGLRATVSDFGLAKRVNPLTLLASARGTRSFKPPEVFRDLQCDSTSGDVWAVGSILYLLLTDRLPFGSQSDLELFDSDCFDTPMILPSRLNAQIDPFLDRVVSRALALKPEDRFASAIELLAQLAKWKPRSTSDREIQKSYSAEGTKTVLGLHMPASENQARRMVEEAEKLSRQAGMLEEAADLLEEAFNQWPDLRAKKEYLVKLWRKGIVR